MYTMVLDTEYIQKKGSKDVYNLGYIIIKDKKQVVKSQSIILTEIFDSICLEYKNKIDEIKDGGIFGKNKIDILLNYKLCTKKYQFVKISDFRQLFISDLQKYKIRVIWGYNVSVDKSAIYDIFFNCNTEILDKIIFCDIMFNIKNFYFNTKKYKDFCDKNNYRTISEKTHRVYYRYSAEIMYRFLIDENFVEQHTALSDVFCEWELLKICYKKRKKLYVKKDVGLKEALKVK